ncbi:MAG: hypothetical protein QQM50_06640 [Dehalococcoides mccartyi]|uniref:hypothetical protein n=1 Tax=Dehalococcoides TaxID=61434 RepID=UPI002737D69B|nr:hypothetical protein [Dehalococcoides mccartyi]MDP4280206.1 hypothetical protein [Dehalococcoides mccartyi]
MKLKRRSSNTDTKEQNKARKAYEEAVLKAFKEYVEAKEQADISHERAIKQANDKQAKEEADIKYRETLEQAKKVRDEVMDEAQKVLSNAMR